MTSTTHPECLGFQQGQSDLYINILMTIEVR